MTTTYYCHTIIDSTNASDTMYTSEAVGVPTFLYSCRDDCGRDNSGNVVCTGTRTLSESLSVYEYGTFGWVRSVIIGKKYLVEKTTKKTEYHTSEHVTIIITTLVRRTKLHHLLQRQILIPCLFC